MSHFNVQLTASQVTTLLDIIGQVLNKSVPTKVAVKEEAVIPVVRKRTRAPNGSKGVGRKKKVPHSNDKPLHEIVETGVSASNILA